MSKLVTIYGGSGFLGRYITEHMARQGWRVRVACRHPNDALFVKTYGTPGQIEPIFCNIRDDGSTAAALLGADAVVNCVGILNPAGKNRFEAVQAEGSARIARLAAAEGVGRFVHLSAIGADHKGQSLYARTKAQGEDAVRHFIPQAHILRPSIVFGPEDAFFNRFASISGFGPVLPVVGAKTRFQPVYVSDIARAAIVALKGDAPSGTYELGGPEVFSFRDMMIAMLAVIQRRKVILNIPFPLASTMAGVFDGLQILTGGIFRNNLITRDQVKTLKTDNVVSGRAKGFAEFGIVPAPLQAVLPEYLWCYRPVGQYADIQASAKNLKSKS